MSLELQHVTAPTDAARRLIGELDAELSGDYAPEQRHGFSVDRVFRADVVFFVALLDGEPAGCGGVAIGTDGLAEVKRMYVRAPLRGRGVARGLLARLEDEARSRGAKRMVL